MGSNSLVQQKKSTKILFNDSIKRIFDFVFSLLGILILLPVFIVIAILIKLDSKGPVLFKQIRVGRNEEFFHILKFRTMVTDAEKLGKQITIGRDNRITRVGHFLRNYKLDEFPQLFNVLVGDMSLVGPRPEVPKYTAYYSKEQKKIFQVRPGITDYASIKYSKENEILANSNDPEQTYINEIMVDKLSINLDYIRKRSLKEDLYIIFATVAKIVK